MPDYDPSLEAFVRSARTDLAARLGVSEDVIAVRSAQAVTWSDASLGCPQPGMAYAQVPEDGTFIELEHAGTVYPYHSGGSRPEPFLCQQSGPKNPPPTIDY
jgi:hypothetical protein